MGYDPLLPNSLSQYCRRLAFFNPKIYQASLSHYAGGTPVLDEATIGKLLKDTYLAADVRPVHQQAWLSANPIRIGFALMLAVGRTC